MVVYFVCILIFGLIVNTIVTKVEIATNLVEVSLMDETLLTGSFLSARQSAQINVDVTVEETQEEPARNSIDLFERGSVH